MILRNYHNFVRCDNGTVVVFSKSPYLRVEMIRYLEFTLICFVLFKDEWIIG